MPLLRGGGSLLLGFKNYSPAAMERSIVLVRILLAQSGSSMALHRARKIKRRRNVKKGLGDERGLQDSSISSLGSSHADAAALV